MNGCALESYSIAEALGLARERLAGGDSPRSDAEILLAHVLECPRSYLLAWPERKLTSRQWTAFKALVERRACGEPVAYLLGVRGFFGLDLAVSPAVLIPRPETELLVEAALERLPVVGGCTVADLGTGSGAIALAIALARPNAQIVAVDASQEALAVASVNADRLGCSNVSFSLANWCQGLGAARFDMIVSNPPYIREDDPHLKQGDLRFEPIMALASGPDGLDAIRTITTCAPAHLLPGGWLLFEHGYDQAEAVAGLMRDAGFVKVESLKDLQGHNRVTLGRFS